MKDDLPLVPPRAAPPLDSTFRPAILANRAFRAAVASAGPPAAVQIALERADGAVARFETVVAPAGHPLEPANFRYLERCMKFLLWSRGGCRIHLAGPPGLASRLAVHYRDSRPGRFDSWLIGEKVEGRPLEVLGVAPDDVPAARESASALGRHWEGCRIGFDLGASDRKVAAVRDGVTVFSEEAPWDPRAQSDPSWHFEQIMDSLRRAAAHLPRVDAIGGSSAGVLVNNRVKVASLFRGVPEAEFVSRVEPIFIEMRRAWGGIPFEVVNDGEVTALAGAMALGENAVLGTALGSSQAAGYVNAEGNVTSWLNELAFAPVDYHPQAPEDEWSHDRGCGVQYFSQQAVGRLIPASGLEIDSALGLPERLVRVQEAMGRGDERAARIYQSIGTYLGYAIPHYAEFYEFRHVLLLGRVTTGEGGAIIAGRAREIVESEFPELAVRLHLPDEKEKRHGQAMAAASLPALDRSRDGQQPAPSA